MTHAPLRHLLSLSLLAALSCGPPPSEGQNNPGGADAGVKVKADGGTPQIGRAPGAPTAVEATAGERSARVRWQAPTDPGNHPVSQYRVVAQPGDRQQLTGAITELTFTALSPGVAYTVVVYAKSAAGEGPASTPSAPVTPTSPSMPRAPASPTNVVAKSAQFGADVSWTAPADSGTSAISRYTVIAAPGGKRSQTFGTTQTRFSDLTDGTRYTFTVIATNSAGDSPESAPSSPVVAGGTVPEAPRAVKAHAVAGYVLVEWDEPESDGGRVVTGYTVTAEPGGATLQSVIRNARFTTLTAGTAYRFTVVATNAKGDGPASAPSAPVTP